MPTLPIGASPSATVVKRWSAAAPDQTPISTLSRQYVAVRMREVVGITNDIVQMAFVTDGEPEWLDASWEVLTNEAGIYAVWARCLIGPGGQVTLAPGNHTVMLRIMDNPEIPVLVPGTVTVI